MRYCIWSVGLVFALIACACAQDEPQPQEVLMPILTVQVLDETGNPVPNATVGLYGLRDFRGSRARFCVSEPSWLFTDATGKVTFPPLPDPQHRGLSEMQKEWLLLVSAPNYLPVRQTQEASEVRGKVHTVRLKRGRLLEIVVRNETGKPLPEPLNLAVFRLHQQEIDAFEYMESVYKYQEGRGFDLVKFHIHSQFGLESLGEGRYRCSIPENYEQPLLVIVYHPGFLRGFWQRIEPEAIAQGRAEIRLPKPCTLIIEVDVSRAPAEAYEKFSLRVGTSVKIGEGFTSFGYGLLEERVEGQRVITLSDLCSDTYDVELQGEPKELGWDEEGQLKTAAEWFFKRAPCKKLSPDEPVRLQLAYEPPDPSRYRGDKQFTITVTMPDGKPAANQPYKLTVRDDSNRELKVLEGTLDSEGRTTLTQLREDVDYELYVANRKESAGSIYLGDPTRHPTPSSFRVPPSEGDRAPDIVLRPVEGNAQKRLSDYKGKWVYIDFWATWCGPCRGALEKLKAELPTLKKLHKDTLAVITLSIDDEPSPVKPYLEKMGLWGKCDHFWAGLGGWYSPASEAFGIRSVPTAVLINPEGIIVWRGHPTSLSLLTAIGQAQQ